MPRPQARRRARALRAPLRDSAGQGRAGGTVSASTERCVAEQASHGQAGHFSSSESGGAAPACALPPVTNLTPYSVTFEAWYRHEHDRES